MNTGAETANAAQQPAATILNFAMAATQADPVEAHAKVVVGRRRAHPDRKLIAACVEYAFQKGGAEAGYEVDPTDSEFATFNDDIARSRANRELATAARSRATTMDGLRAKAALLPIILFEDFGLGAALDDCEHKFILSLSADIVRMQRGAMDQKQSRVPFPAPRR